MNETNLNICRQFWDNVLSKFRALEPGVTQQRGPRDYWCPIPVGHNSILLEWAVRGRRPHKRLEINLQFQLTPKEEGMQLLQDFEEVKPQLESEIDEGLEFDYRRETRGSPRIAIKRTFGSMDELNTPEMETWAADSMAKTYRAVKPRLDRFVGNRPSGGPGNVRQVAQNPVKPSPAAAQPQPRAENAHEPPSPREPAGRETPTYHPSRKPDARDVQEKIDRIRSIEMPNAQLLGEFADNNVRNLKADSQAEAVMNTALAINWGWEKQALPRLEAFLKAYPEVRSLEDLRDLLVSMSPREVCNRLLRIHPSNPGQNSRYLRLKNLVNGLIRYKESTSARTWDEALMNWAERFDGSPQDPLLGLKHIGLATVQNLRLVLGLDTFKPDRQVLSVLRELGFGEVDDYDSVKIMKWISEVTGYRVVELDQLFWHYRAKNLTL